MNSVRISITVLVISIAAACNKTSAKKSELEIEEPKSQTYKTKDSIESRYTMFYKFTDGDDNQTLAVAILDTNTIKFHLAAKTLPCDTNFWGKAMNSSAFDGEIDSDKGEGYPSTQYNFDHEELELFIRLADDQSKAIVKFHMKDSLDGTDCVPIEDEIMRRVNKI